MPSRNSYASPTSPPQGRWRDHSPQKSSPLRHAVSTRSNNSDTENSSLPSRQGTISSHAGSCYSNGSYSGYDSASDPFVSRSTPTSTSTLKRDRSESPVKKNSAFAKWEQREQAEQQDQHKPSSAHRRAQTMDISPKKVKDDDWRAGLGRSESRAALKPVASNTLPHAAPDMPPPPPRTPTRQESPSRKENGGYREYRVENQDALMPPPPKPGSHSRGMSVDSGLAPSPEPVRSTSPSSPRTSKNSMATITRSDSMRASTRPRERGHARFGSMDDRAPHLDGEDLAKLQKSSTPQFRHLSKMASEEGGEDYSIHSPEEQVTGLAGRRRLQRSGSTRPNANKQSKFGSQYASTRWMDTQRKHLQAYEYLCHIGEARAWIEDVLDPIELPPIVQLEEALRNGVTLAEVVVRLASSMDPESQHTLGSQRIFRNARLQFRHSDNIALFFRFLSTIELPELFRFELVDLYEKKNIPKVIYCIHALSWLLYRKGIVEFRIGNLVGQLEFAEHELEEAQKGIDRSGVAMPNFGGMREAMQVEPEAEPEPTPEELVLEQEEVVMELQAQMRGALARMQLGGVMQDLWDAEQSIALFQAMARGGFAREIFDFKYTMDRSTREFQAAAKSFLVRRKLLRKQRAWRENKVDVVKVQNLWRGRQQRAETKQIKRQLQNNRHGLKDLQAAIRGALGRWKAGDMWHETREAGADIESLQAQARGMLERMRVGHIMNALWYVEHGIVDLQAIIRGSRARRTTKHQTSAVRKSAVDVVRLQALARGLIHRKEQKQQHGHFEVHQENVANLQSAARGLLSRLQNARTKGALQGREPSIAKLQAAARGQQVRTETADIRNRLQKEHGQVQDLQSLARAMLQRRSIGTQLAALEKQEATIENLQSLARAYIERTRVYDQLCDMEKEEASVTNLQSVARAMLERSRVGHLLEELEQYEADITDIQSAARAFVVRKQHEQKQKHYKENMQKVIKLQSFVRAKQQGESYQSLVNGKNPPLPVVRKHLHLLTDTNLEFEGEIEAERLRRQVVESVRRNELVEGYVEGLDVKIALLVKNKITLDEVVKHQKHFGGSASQLLRNGSTMGHQNGNGFDLKALNKSSRKKLSGYEELFFMLQTQPIYLARLFQAMASKGLPEKEGKNLERLMLTLFGYAQKNREEYFLLKLFGTSTRQTVSQARDIEEYQRMLNAAFSQRLLLSYVRSPKDRGYLKTLLGGMVKEGICAQDHLDLESDPLQIYRAILNNDELSTGRPSQRPRDLPREVVIREPDVRPKYVEHLQDLRDLCDAFFQSIEETMHRMPYGVRFVATEQYHALCDRFPRDDQAQLAMLAGSWLWKSLPSARAQGARDVGRHRSRDEPSAEAQPCTSHCRTWSSGIWQTLRCRQLVSSAAESVDLGVAGALARVSWSHVRHADAGGVFRCRSILGSLLQEQACRLYQTRRRLRHAHLDCRQHLDCCVRQRRPDQGAAHRPWHCERQRERPFRCSSRLRNYPYAEEQVHCARGSERGGKTAFHCDKAAGAVHHQGAVWRQLDGDPATTD